MILRTTSKLDCCRARSGNSYAVAALAAATANKSENESAKASGSDGVSASEAPKVKRKRVSRAERRVIVADFVHKYKAINDGMLPCTSTVVKQVGGSYYVVKIILQELESQLKQSSADNANQNTTGKEILNQNGHMFDDKAILTSMPVNAGIENDFKMVVTNHVDINDASENHTEAERASQYSSSTEKSSSKEDCYFEFSTEKSGLLKGDAANVLHLSHEKLDMTEATDNVADFVEMPSSLLGEEFDHATRSCHVNDENGRLMEALGNGDSKSSAKETSFLKRDAENVSDSSHKKMDMTEAKDNVADFIEMPSSLQREEFDNASCPGYGNSENSGLKETLANGDNSVSVKEENRLYMVDTKRVSHPGFENLEDNKHKEAISGELQNKDGSKDKTEYDEGSPKHQSARDTSRWQTSESELPKKSTLWGTLRSLADGIINIWRKS